MVHNEHWLSERVILYSQTIKLKENTTTTMLQPNFEMHCRPCCNFLNLRKTSIVLTKFSLQWGWIWNYQINKKKKMQILVTSLHINQEIKQNLHVSSITLGENKSSKIQKPLYLPKPKHQSVQPLHIRRAIQEQFFLCMLHWLLHGVGRFLEQVCLSTISGIHHSIKQMVFP